MKLIKKYLNPSGPIYSTIALPEVEVRPRYPRMPKESDYMSDEELAEAFATPLEYLDAASLRYLLNLYHTDYGKFKQEWERLHPGSTAEGRQAMKDLQAILNITLHIHLGTTKAAKVGIPMMLGAVGAPIVSSVSAVGNGLTALGTNFPMLAKGASTILSGMGLAHFGSPDGVAKTGNKFSKDWTNFLGNRLGWTTDLLSPEGDRGWVGSFIGDLADISPLTPFLRAFNKTNQAVNEALYSKNLGITTNDPVWKPETAFVLGSLRRTGDGASIRLNPETMSMGLLKAVLPLSKEDYALALTPLGVLLLLKRVDDFYWNEIKLMPTKGYEHLKTLVKAPNEELYLQDLPGNSKANPMKTPSFLKGSTSYVLPESEIGGTYLDDDTYRLLGIQDDVSPAEFDLLLNLGDNRVLLQYKGIEGLIPVRYDLARGNYGSAQSGKLLADWFVNTLGKENAKLFRFLLSIPKNKVLDLTRNPRIILHNGVTSAFRRGGYLQFQQPRAISNFMEFTGGKFLNDLEKYDPEAIRIIKTSPELLTPELQARLRLYNYALQSHINYDILHDLSRESLTPIKSYNPFDAIIGYDHMMMPIGNNPIGGSGLLTDIVTTTGKGVKQLK